MKIVEEQVFRRGLTMRTWYFGHPSGHEGKVTEDFRENGTISKVIFLNYAGTLYHRPTDEGPAIIHYYPDGKVQG